MKKLLRILDEAVTGAIVLIASAGLFLLAHAAEIPNTSVFSQTDGSNNSGTVPSWAEGMAPSQVNDSARALQGAITRNWNWEHPTLTSGGSANAQTLTYSVAPAAYYNGQRFCFEAGFATTSTSTLNVNTLGAVAIKYLSSGTLTDTGSNTIRAGDRLCVTYRSTGPSFVIEAAILGGTTIGAVGSSTDNAITRWDGTGGNAIQNSSSWIIDDSGRMVRGSATALTTFLNTTVTPSLQNHGTGADSGAVGFSRFSADSSPPALRLAKSRNAAIGSYTVVQSGDRVSTITGEGDDGDEFQEAARISVEIDGTPGDADMPGRVTFNTSPDSSATPLERMRIDSGHNIFAYKDDGANPGQVVAEHMCKLDADYTLADSTSPQKLFDCTTNGRITVDTGQYFYKCQLYITAMSATSGNGQFLWGGTATLGGAELMQVVGVDSSTPLTAGAAAMSGAQDTASAASMVTAATGTGLLATINGTFDVTVAGTLIPQIDLVTGGVTPVVESGSYCKLNRAANTATDNIGAWD